MRSLERNKQTIYYSLKASDSEVVDGNGYYTGEINNTYGAVVEYKINVGGANGKVARNIYGYQMDYDRVMRTNDLSCPIDIDTILWVGIDTTLPHNYIVTYVSKTLNSITYGIKEVLVSESGN